jgi:hypothetical protein
MASAERSCFGYAIQSSLPLVYLRPGSGMPMHVSERGDLAQRPAEAPLLEWLPRPDHPYRASLYAAGDGYLLWTEHLGTMEIDPMASSIILSPTQDPARREAGLWGIPLALCFAQRGDLPLHAAAVDVGGSAILLAAPGCWGKTTLAAAFLQAGYRILSEDISCYRQSPTPTLLPGPAMLRVRRDGYERGRFAGTQVVAEDEQRVYLAVDAARRGDGAPVPVSAIVFLRSAASGVTLARVAPADAMRDLWALSFRLPTDADRVRCFEGIATLASSVPIWDLHRPLEFANLPEVVETVSLAVARHE